TASQAKEYVEKTGVTSLAIAVGSIHGITLNEKMENPHLNLERIKEIDQALEGKINLVLHGGSGTPEDDIRKAVELGIVKINVNTEIRVAFRQALELALKQNPDETTPYKLMPLIVSGVSKVVEEKIKLFNSDNKL
ncbi:class II fructose-bisphosphate aldolase, partial [Patescibacteria group bacterium]|nr:class II fructose-bisphosphate aldolase [Patescibacteria group bacterium]